MVISDMSVVQGSGVLDIAKVGNEVQISLKNGGVLKISPRIEDGEVVNFIFDFEAKRDRKAIEKIQKKVDDLMAKIAEIQEKGVGGATDEDADPEDVDGSDDSEDVVVQEDSSKAVPDENAEF